MRMKWFVGVLVVANLGYFGYQFGIAEPRGLDAHGDHQALADAPLESMGGLLLLTELDGHSLRPRRPRPSIAAAETASTERQTVTAETAVVSADAGAESEAESAAEPAQEPGAEKLPPAAATPTTEPALDKTSNARVLAEQGTPRTLCFTVGPLEETAPINKLTAWFEARSLTTRLSSAERREVAFHWVFFAPLPNRKEALAKVATMSEKGIDDMVVMRKGDMAHGISLGAFSRAVAADRRVRELRAKGYEPSVDVRHFVRRSRWMDVVARNNRPEADFAKAFPSLQINERSCESSELDSDEVVKTST